VLTVLVLSAALTSFGAHADNQGPCREIRSACEAGGFTKGGHKDGKNKGLFKDCMKKVMNGEKVEGVTIAPEQISACKDKKEKRHSKSDDQDS
jgi:hypothetical protein